ncbi:uncharacterized protein ARMOST_02815 [Armillaria ostoyae]|uniref:Uncharacterized protein n=1 Tax=Armillaria ostoyae TaxID=47428 RepID=A0A284QSQ8_ARMOS|nr:uncharacterized protein ARMOST_02815 [Armillaria ostoyae]
MAQLTAADIQSHLDQKIETLKEEQQRNCREIESMFAGSRRALKININEELQRNHREIDEALKNTSDTPLVYEEPKDDARMNTLCKDTFASAIAFVPAPTPPLVGPNNAPSTTVDELAAKIDALMEAKDREIADLQEQIQALQVNSEDVIDWLITVNNDSKSMDRLRLRHVLDCGQARLAKVTHLPVVMAPPRSAGDLSRVWRAHLSECADNDKRLVKARSLVRNSGDAETRDLSDEVMHLFVDFPSDIRTAGDSTSRTEGLSGSHFTPAR